MWKVKKHSCFVRTDDSTIKKLSELILDEFYHWDSNSDGMVSSYLMQVLVTLERLLDGGLAGTKNRIAEQVNFASAHCFRPKIF